MNDTRAQAKMERTLRYCMLRVYKLIDGKQKGYKEKNRKRAYPPNVMRMSRPHVMAMYFIWLTASYHWGSAMMMFKSKGQLFIH